MAPHPHLAVSRRLVAVATASGKDSRAGSAARGRVAQGKRSQGARTDKLPEGDHRKLTQRQAAADVGLSEHQEHQSVRIANIPAEQFESLIESDDPPTVTQLAEMRKKSPGVSGCRMRPAPRKDTPPAGCEARSTHHSVPPETTRPGRFPDRSTSRGCIMRPGISGCQARPGRFRLPFDRKKVATQVATRMEADENSGRYWTVTTRK